MAVMLGHHNFIAVPQLQTASVVAVQSYKGCIAVFTGAAVRSSNDSSC